MGSSTNMISNIMKHLIEYGWGEVPVDSYGDLIELALSLGTPIPSRRNGPVVDWLQPRSRDEANPKSMSAIFGKGAFPLHTDAAYIYVPPRFMILRMAQGTSSRPTLLLDTKMVCDKQNTSALFRDVWLVNGGSRRFYTTIFNSTLIQNHVVVRYDPCCMRPTHTTFSRSAELLRESFENIKPFEIHWSSRKTIVIDNWRMLHGRGTSAFDDSDTRCLERVLIR